METAEQSKLAMHREAEVAVADSPEQGKDFGADDERASPETLSTDYLGEKVTPGTLGAAEPTSVSENDKLDFSETRVCSEMPCQDEKEAVALQPGHDELNRNESVASSVSDTLSSVDSVYENEASRKRQDIPEQDPEQERAPEPEQHPEPEQYPEPQEDPEPEPEQYPEPLDDPEPEPEQYPEPLDDPEPEPEQYPEPLDDPEPEQYPEPLDNPEPKPEQYPEPQEDPEPEQYPEPLDNPEPKPEQYPEPQEDSEKAYSFEPELYPNPEQDPDPELFPDPELYPDPEQDPDPELFPDPELYPDPELCPDPEQETQLEAYPEPDPEAGDNTHEDESFQNLGMYANEDTEANELLFDSCITEESVLERCIREEVMSDVSNESCRDPDPDEMDECLRVEIAAASSDSETDEKWRAIFSSSINKEDDDSYLDSLQLSAQELFVQKVEVTDFEEQDDGNVENVHFDVSQGEEVLEQPEDIISFPAAPQEVKYNHPSLQGLSKISEDDSESIRDVSHNHTIHQENNDDTNKKLPKDFCVIQETKSENVSTEHVDFRLARKQWREMEEQTKNKIVLPTTKQLSFHGSHSFMYTPVRNIERTYKKAHDLENLNLVRDYPHAQFSPCSEDSGLDDSSYRSPYDDPETPVDREIHIPMEREDTFKRGLSRMGKSTDCVPSRGIPRSISTPLTPSFIITSSPTKEPHRHDVSANNIIILDPSSDFTSSPRHVSDSGPARSGEWRCEDSSSSLIILETSNLIIRSASEFSLNKACDEPQEKMFLNNPFFKLRSRSQISLVDEEIKMVKQREEELRKERANLYGKDRFKSERGSNQMDTLAFSNSVDVPQKCKSSPSSPMKTAYRMDRSTLSCDHRFPEAYTGGRRKSAMALRWEAGEFTKND